MNEKRQYNWAVLGTGVIANEMAQAMEKAGRRIYGVSNRTYEKAAAFAEKYGVEKVYRDCHEMFTDDNVDIIYISTPHNTHSQFFEEALANKKHILCEKSITLNTGELSRAKELARENHVILAEAMTIYHMPLYKQLKAVADSGKLGALRMIQLNFGSFKEYNMTNRFFNRELAGGALLDIGVYAISLARYFMSQKPDQIQSQVKYAPTGVDEQAGILLMNQAGEMAAITLTLHAKQPKRGVIAFEKGYIEIMEYPRADEAVFVYTESGERETLTLGKMEDALWYEMEDMEAAVASGENTMLINYTEDVMDIMTGIRREWGLVYPEEE